MRDAVTAQATAPSWTWQEPPPSRAPIRVPVTPARWRVGTPPPGDRDLSVVDEVAEVLGMDVAAETCPDLDVIAADFTARIAARDMVPYRGIHLWEHTRPGFPVLTAWAYVLPAHHPFQDPHPVDPADTSIDLVAWAFRANRAATGADRARRAVDPFTPPIEWTFRAHPATIRDLMQRDRAAKHAHSEECANAAKEASQAADRAAWSTAALLHAPPPSPLLAQSWTPDGGSGWTINGRRLEQTTRVEPGMLHAHQILPVGGATPSASRP